MPRPKDIAPTYAEIMTKILDSALGPIPVIEFSEQILALRPASAKNPMRTFRDQVRQENGRLLVFLDAETILPIRLAMQGARFRLQLDRDAINTGLINIDDRLSSYLPRQFSLEKVCLLDADEHPIDFRVRSATEKVMSVFGA